MRLLRIKLSTFATIFAGILFLASCDPPEISVSSSNLNFQADETGEKSVSITTDASKWEVQKGTPDWINVNENHSNDQLFVSVQNYTDTKESRTGTITLSVKNRSKTATAEIFVEQQKKPNSLSVTQSLSYEANETGNKTINVTTDADSWSMSTDATWIQLTKQEQDKVVIVNVSSQNTQSTARQAVITFTAGTAQPVICTVTQAGKDILGISATSLSFKPDETTGQTVEVTTTASSWNATSSTSWLTVAKNNNTLTATASRNTTTTSRYANITFTAGSANNVILPVVQGFDNLSISESSLTFGYNETTAKNVSVTTNVSSWNATTTDSWVRINMNSNILSVNPTSTNTGAQRTATVTVTAGYAQSVTLQIIQEGSTVPTPTLSVTPTSRIFTWNSQTPLDFTVTTNQSSWSAEKMITAAWLDITPNGNLLTVKPNSNNTTTSSRTVSIRFTAGTATPVTVTVTQNINSTWPPRSNYTATGTPLMNSSQGYNYTTWTGEIIPNTTSTTTPPSFYEVTRWANSSAHIYLDYVNGQFMIDNYTIIIEDDTGQYDGYLVWGTYNSAGNGLITYYLEDDRIISYNATTRVLEAGTYNGLPVVLAIIPRDKTTGEWLIDSWFFNIYSNLRFTLTPSSSAPQIRSNPIETGVVMKSLPSDIKVIVGERQTTNNSHRIIKKQ